MDKRLVNCFLDYNDGQESSLKGGSTTNKTRDQKLRIDMINIPSKYFFKIMLGFPAAAVAAKSSLAQKQTLVAKKRTLESK